MRKIFLGAGHSNIPGRDRGAASGNNIEGELTVEFRTLLANALEEEGICAVLDESRNIFTETYNKFLKLTAGDSLVIDIHFNSGPPAATGAEVIIDDQYTGLEMELAKGMLQVISQGLDIKSRGVRPESLTAHKKILWFDIPGVNLLLELCFISNAVDMAKYHSKKMDLARHMALYIKSVL